MKPILIAISLLLFGTLPAWTQNAPTKESIPVPKELQAAVEFNKVYSDSGNPFKAPPKESKLPDGSVAKEFPNGTTETSKPDGSTVVKDANGFTTTVGGLKYPQDPRCSTREITVTTPDGKVVKPGSYDGTPGLNDAVNFTSPDGAITAYTSGGSTRTKHKDGTVVIRSRDSDGKPYSVEIKHPDGSSEHYDADGSYSIYRNDGVTIYHLFSKISRQFYTSYSYRDGTTLTIYTDGTREVTKTIDGKLVVEKTNPDGSFERYEFKDGKMVASSSSPPPVPKAPEKEIPESGQRTFTDPLSGDKIALAQSSDSKASAGTPGLLSITGDGKSTNQISISMQNLAQTPMHYQLDQGSFFIPSSAKYQVMMTTAPVSFDFPPGATVSKIAPTICADRKDALPPGPSSKEAPQYSLGPHPVPYLNQFMKSIPEVVTKYKSDGQVGNSELSKDAANLMQQVAWLEAGKLTSTPKDDISPSSIEAEVLKQIEEGTQQKPNPEQKKAVNDQVNILWKEINLCQKRSTELASKI